MIDFPHWELGPLLHAAFVEAVVGSAVVGICLLVGAWRAEFTSRERLGFVVGTALFIEGILQALFWILASDPDIAEFGMPWPQLITVGILAVIITPAVSIWRSRVWWRHWRTNPSARPAV